MVKYLFIDQILSDFLEEKSRVRVSVGFSVELDCFQLFSLVKQMPRVFRKQILNLLEIVLLGQLDGFIPLVEQHAAIDPLFDVAASDVGLNCRIADADVLKLIPKQNELFGALRDLVEQLFELVVVLRVRVGRD